MKDTEKKLEIIVDSCENKKGIDIRTLDIRDLTGIADYFVIVSGNSSTQVSALADEIDRKMSDAGFEKENLEGKQSARWILLDFGDIIVHVFHKEEREYYGLERLWNEKSENDKGEDNYGN